MSGEEHYQLFQWTGAFLAVEIYQKGGLGGHIWRLNKMDWILL